MDHQTDPDEILELVFCDCKKAKFTEQGQCALLQIPSFLVQIFANAKSNVIMKSQHHIHRYTHWFLVYITLPKYPPKFGGEDPSNNIQHIYIKQKKQSFSGPQFQILVLKICKTLKKALTFVLRFKLLIFAQL